MTRNRKLLLVGPVAALVAILALPTLGICENAYAIEDVSDCVNPSHYGVEKISDIKNRRHSGEVSETCYDEKQREEIIKTCVNPDHYGVTHTSEIVGKTHKLDNDILDDCYTKEQRDKDVEKQYKEWLKVVKQVNAEYTRVYNEYASSLHEKDSIKEEIAEIDARIEQKQSELAKVANYSYKQNYQGELLASILTGESVSDAVNKKKYLDSTVEYMNSKADEVKAERKVKQAILDEVTSHIEEKKSTLMDVAYHINDTLPECSDELTSYIDENCREIFTDGRVLVDQNLSDDWLIDVALYYVGTPYIWGGKSENGADCSGYTSLVYRKATGKEIGASTWNQREQLSNVDKKDLERGDVLFMDNAQNASYQHVGIFVEGNTYIHNSGTGTLARLDSGIDYFTCGLRVSQ